MSDLSVHTALCWDQSRGCRDTVTPVCLASYTGCTCHRCVGALSWCCLGRHYKLSLWNQTFSIKFLIKLYKPPRKFIIVKLDNKS